MIENILSLDVAVRGNQDPWRVLIASIVTEKMRSGKNGSMSSRFLPIRSDRVLLFTAKAADLPEGKLLLYPA